jgi:co-chaperonin GroES (HSP10)
MDKKITPYTNFLWIEPNEKTSVIVSSQRRLQTFGKVKAVGPEVKYTKVGATVAFELWDKPECEIDGITYHLVRESDALFQLEV